MRTCHIIGAALLATSVSVGAGKFASAVDVTSGDEVHAVMEVHGIAVDSPAAGEKAAPHRYGKGPTRGGGGRGGRGCGCG